MATQTDIRTTLIDTFNEGSGLHKRAFTQSDFEAAFDAAFGELIGKYYGMWDELNDRIITKMRLMGHLARALAEADKRDMTIEDFRNGVRIVCHIEFTWICRLLLKIIGDFAAPVEWPRPPHTTV